MKKPLIFLAIATLTGLCGCKRSASEALNATPTPLTESYFIVAKKSAPAQDDAMVLKRVVKQPDLDPAANTSISATFALDTTSWTVVIDEQSQGYTISVSSGGHELARIPNVPFSATNQFAIDGTSFVIKRESNTRPPQFRVTYWNCVDLCGWTEIQ